MGSGPAGRPDVETDAATEVEMDVLRADLTRLVSETRTADAVRARTRERHLRDAAAADATLLGVLVDLAEQEQPLALRCRSGRVIEGRIVLVARDAVAVDNPAGLRTFVRTDSVATVRYRSRAADQAGDRGAPRDTTFAALVGGLAAERPRVALTVEGEPGVLTGELRSAGVDVLAIRPDGDSLLTVHVATAQVSALTVLASG